jgi:hypothetical protein
VRFTALISEIAALSRAMALVEDFQLYERVRIPALKAHLCFVCFAML